MTDALPVSKKSPAHRPSPAGQVTREPVRTRAVDSVVQKTVSQTTQEEQAEGGDVLCLFAISFFSFRF